MPGRDARTLEHGFTRKNLEPAFNLVIFAALEGLEWTPQLALKAIDGKHKLVDGGLRSRVRGCIRDRHAHSTAKRRTKLTSHILDGEKIIEIGAANPSLRRWPCVDDARVDLAVDIPDCKRGNECGFVDSKL